MKKLFAKLKNPKVLRVIVMALVVAFASGGFLLYQLRAGKVSIDNSLVDAPIINVAPTTAGKLMEMDVHENQQVKKGDPLAIVGSSSLYADNDGLIIMANNEIGSVVNAQTPVVQMIWLPDMRIAGTIDENKGLKDIRVGQVASFTVDALPGKTFWGYVDEVSPSAKQTQLAFSISSERPTQQFVVYVKYDSIKYAEIKNGMSAKITVYTHTN
ncbi:MAG: efflux RND transporter periplasmic adaptor subunit [Candidatus Levyibacteriota bacterium]